MNNLFIVVSAVSVYNFQLAAASPATGEKTRARAPSTSNNLTFTRSTLASAGISCRRVSACLSVRLSQVSVLLKRLNVGSRKQRCHDSPVSK